MSLRRVSYIPKNLFWIFLSSIIKKQCVKGRHHKDLTNYLRTKVFRDKNVVLTSSGIQALEIMLRYLGYTASKKILVPVYTASVVRRLLEALEVDFTLVDINPHNANISLKDLQRNLSANHFDGILCIELNAILHWMCGMHSTTRSDS